jgi:hypothetical protein
MVRQKHWSGAGTLEQLDERTSHMAILHTDTVLLRRLEYRRLLKLVPCSTVATRGQDIRMRVQQALGELRACSTLTLDRLASELVAQSCNNCDQDLSCDACDARCALGAILNAVAAITQGEL